MGHEKIRRKPYALRRAHPVFGRRLHLLAQTAGRGAQTVEGNVRAERLNRHRFHVLAVQPVECPREGVYRHTLPFAYADGVGERVFQPFEVRGAA